MQKRPDTKPGMTDMVQLIDQKREKGKALQLFAERLRLSQAEFK